MISKQAMRRIEALADDVMHHAESITKHDIALFNRKPDKAEALKHKAVYRPWGMLLQRIEIELLADGNTDLEARIKARIKRAADITVKQLCERWSLHNAENIGLEERLEEVTAPDVSAMLVIQTQYVLLAQWLRAFVRLDEPASPALKSVEDKPVFPADSKDTMRPSLDFMTFTWGQEVFTFNRPMQRKAIKVLWDAWESRRPHVQVEDLRDLVESSETAKPSDWFRDNPAWGKLIVTPEQGWYTLRSPESTK